MQIHAHPNPWVGVVRGISPPPRGGGGFGSPPKKYGGKKKFFWGALFMFFWNKSLRLKIFLKRSPWGVKIFWSFISGGRSEREMSARTPRSVLQRKTHKTENIHYFILIWRK